MLKTHGYAVQHAQDQLAPFQFERRKVQAHDVFLEILYCGVCHSDIHQARDEWSGSIYPMVPGHEIVGRVIQIGTAVKQFAVGDMVGVGCMVDSCRQCTNCHENLEQFCATGASFTYNSYEQDKKTPTYGGYSNNIVVNEKFVLHMPTQLDLAHAAPLLCAGITTYSPMKHWQVQTGQAVGIIGLGGLGHMAIQFAHAMGAHVTLFTTSPNKQQDALQLGADQVIISKDNKAMSKLANHFDFILDTVSGNHDINPYLTTLKRDGVMVLVGIPTKPHTVNASNLIASRRQLAGSLIGGIAETQEMLDYCAQHNIHCQVEMIDIQNINQAYERMIKGDVKYRFVIDMQSLSA